MIIEQTKISKEQQLSWGCPPSATHRIMVKYYLNGDRFKYIYVYSEQERKSILSKIDGIDNAAVMDNILSREGFDNW